MRQFGELEAVIMHQLWAWGRPALATSPDRRTALAHFVLQMNQHDAELLRQALDQAQDAAEALV
jgi:predicted transcriptional regulator